MRNSLYILLLVCCLAQAQNNTFSPYSRYGFGQMMSPTLAHNAGMGGAYIAFKPDSTMPVFVNTGNPAAYALVRVTSLEVGGRFLYSDFTSQGGKARRWGTNFQYGALGFPVGAKGGACLGIMPYSVVGYDAQGGGDAAAGTISTVYNGVGGLNRAFLGYGVMPFKNRLLKFQRRHPHQWDTLGMRPSRYRGGAFFARLLSDFSGGVNANYIFGNISNSARVIYSNSLLYNNTYRERDLTLGDFTGNFGMQTAITVDSVRSHGKRRWLSEKVKITMGYFMTIDRTMTASYSNAAYNYILNGSGNEVLRDTAEYKVNVKSHFHLPVEQGIGIGFKKSERINVVADMAVTHWAGVHVPGTAGSFQNSYRFAIGGQLVPEKAAAGRGALLRRMQYRVGASHETGYIKLNGHVISTTFFSAGIGIPVGIGRLASMVNASVQYGWMGTTAAGLTRENFVRINFGFTFSDRWFQKFRYD